MGQKRRGAFLGRNGWAAVSFQQIAATQHPPPLPGKRERRGRQHAASQLARGLVVRRERHCGARDQPRGWLAFWLVLPLFTTTLSLSTPASSLLGPFPPCVLCLPPLHLCLIDCAWPPHLIAPARAAEKKRFAALVAFALRSISQPLFTPLSQAVSLSCSLSPTTTPFCVCLSKLNRASAQKKEGTKSWWVGGTRGRREGGGVKCAAARISPASEPAPKQQQHCSSNSGAARAARNEQRVAPTTKPRALYLQHAININV